MIESPRSALLLRTPQTPPGHSRCILFERVFLVTAPVVFTYVNIGRFYKIAGRFRYSFYITCMGVAKFVGQKSPEGTERGEMKFENERVMPRAIIA